MNKLSIECFFLWPTKTVTMSNLIHVTISLKLSIECFFLWQDNKRKVVFYQPQPVLDECIWTFQLRICSPNPTLHGFSVLKGVKFDTLDTRLPNETSGRADGRETRAKSFSSSSTMGAALQDDRGRAHDRNPARARALLCRSFNAAKASSPCKKHVVNLGQN